MSGVRHIRVGPEDDGQRLDRWLKKQGVPFSLLHKIIRTGQVRINGKRVKADTRLAGGQEVRLPPLQDPDAGGKKKKTTAVPEGDAAFLRQLVIYDDGDIVAINKPAGLATQGGSKIKKHIDGMLAALTDKKTGLRPKLVHRLDRDTSGVLLLARQAETIRALGRIFKGRHIRKYYWAIVTPAPTINEGEISVPLRKGESVNQENGENANRENKEKMVVDPARGQKALSLFQLIERAATRCAFVIFWPRTGRTHQIRVHAAYMGCPILGDGKYGESGAMDPFEDTGVARRLHLHAGQISFTHPKTGKMLSISADLPPDLKKSWHALGFDPKVADPLFPDVDL